MKNLTNNNDKDSYLQQKYTKVENLQKMFRERIKIQSRSDRILYILKCCHIMWHFFINCYY